MLLKGEKTNKILIFYHFCENGVHQKNLTMKLVINTTNFRLYSHRRKTA